MRIHANVIRALVLPAVAAAALGTAGTAAAKDYIVVLRSGTNVAEVVRQHDALTGVQAFLTYRHAVRGYAADLSKPALAAVRRDPRVAYVVEDKPLRLSGQSSPTGVRRIGADQVTRSAAAAAAHPMLGDVGVAVIDTGIDLDHPDLGTVVPAVNCIAGSALPDDDNGHGTHVAGTIGALDNDFGVVGIAPDVTLYAVKIFDAKGNGSWATALCGIDWVAANAAFVRVANMSFTGRGYVTPSGPGCVNGNQDVLHTAVCALTTAGVTLVAASGNDHANAASYVPAAYDEVIAVSALSDTDGAPGAAGPASCSPRERDDAFATFSNWGPAIDVAAPGVCIESTFKNGGYRIMSGTSMAAPHVTGAVALLLAGSPSMRPAEVRARLVAQQEPGPIPGDPDTFAEGVVRAATSASPAVPASAPPVGTVTAPAAPPVPAIPAAPAPPAVPALPVVAPPAVVPFPATGGLALPL